MVYSKYPLKRNRIAYKQLFLLGRGKTRVEHLSGCMGLFWNVKKGGGRGCYPGGIVSSYYLLFSVWESSIRLGIVFSLRC